MARLDYFAPGVYVEEVTRGSRAIQGVSLSVAGFVGFTEDIRGDAEIFEPTLVTSWSQYLENFSKVGSDGFTDFGAYLPFAVKGWFENGGGRCWVVSIGSELPIPDTAPTQENEERVLALTPINTSGRKKSLTFSLKSEKEEEGRVKVLIEPDDPIPSGDPNEEFFNSGEFFKIKIVPNDGEEEEFRHLTMDPAGAPTPDDPSGARPTGRFVRTALTEGYTYTSSMGETKEQGPSQYVNIEITAEAGFALAQRPSPGAYEVRPPAQRLRTKQWYPKMYGSTKRRSGMQGLFEVDEVAMVACPDLMLVYQRGLFSLDQVHSVMEMMITNCETSAPGPAYRMAVIDPPPVKPIETIYSYCLNSKNPKMLKLGEWIVLDAFSQFSALYYPWIEVPNPKKAGKSIAIPPCGHMMGLWCRTDESRGIHKAPANEIPRGVTGLAYDTNFREQEFLNPKGINCVRKFRNRGTLVWGARTMAQLDDTDWRYVSVRRLMSYISKSIEEGTQWAVFEPNDEDLWARVTRTVKNFLERMWRQGALFGNTPEDAFFVKCDAELNTPETMKLGQLFVEVGVCPVRPAEFVVFRISQWDQSQDT